jgi:hypothetical protein
MGLFNFSFKKKKNVHPYKRIRTNGFQSSNPTTIEILRNGGKITFGNGWYLEGRVKEDKIVGCYVDKDSPKMNFATYEDGITRDSLIAVLIYLKTNAEKSVR